jgi:hypothetical protein
VTAAAAAAGENKRNRIVSKLHEMAHHACIFPWAGDCFVGICLGSAVWHTRNQPVTAAAAAAGENKRNRIVSKLHEMAHHACIFPWAGDCFVGICLGSAVWHTRNQPVQQQQQQRQKQEEAYCEQAACHGSICIFPRAGDGLVGVCFCLLSGIRAMSLQ